MRPGVTLPIVDFLAELPALAINGSCFAMDRRATMSSAYAFIYVLVPTSSSTATFWRMDIAAKTIVQLATPTFDANTLIGSGTAMCYDESAARIYLFTPQATTAGGLEWARFQYYDIAAGTWTARTVVTMGLGAAWGTDARMVHTCSSIAVDPIIGATADRYFYLVGNASLNLYRFDATNNTWTVLAGGGGARGGAPGAGANLMWNAYNTNRLESFRGGGSTLADGYTISTDTWAAGVASVPPIIVTTGFESTSTWSQGIVSYIAQAGQVYAFDHSNGQIRAIAHIDGVDGAAHTGNGLVYYMVGDKLYFAIRPHSGTAVQRIRAIL